MARVVSIFLPKLSIERIQHSDPSLDKDQPLAVIAKTGAKRWVYAANDAAIGEGVRQGMAAAKAKAMITNLIMSNVDKAGDLAALERLALWMLLHYSPVVAMDPPDGIVMDTEGADHLHAGEAMMLSGLVNRFRAKGLTARAAVADTWGAAHALARVGRQDTIVVPRGDTTKAVAHLPISSLRLPKDTLVSVMRLGFNNVGELAAVPRAPIALRYGPELGRRIDQMFGHIAEPIDPIRPLDVIAVRKSFSEPISAAETIAKYGERLVRQLCLALQEQALGVRRADMIIHRVDNTLQALRIGTARPVRDVNWLIKLLRQRIERIDPGYGIEMISLTAVIVEPLGNHQVSSTFDGEEGFADIAPLIDVLGNRVGQRVYRLKPVASDVPERGLRRVAPMAVEDGETWQTKWPRPARLFARAERIDVLAVLPDHPPVRFTWRNTRYSVKRADGPERIFGEWWRRKAEWAAVRDYFVVEVTSGERYWIYRQGDGVDPGTGAHHWFLHGVFA